MKKILVTALLALMAVPAFADVGVSVNIGEPGFFGRIDIGDSPRPRVVRSQPVIIERTQVVEDPYYLRVPVDHQRHWKRYCRQYGACNHPVYFVQDDWYRTVYAPQYRQRHGGDHHDYSDDRADHRAARANHDYSDDKADHREQREDGKHDYSDDKEDHERYRERDSH